MDPYTAEAKAMVEKRFSDSRDGIYRAHQPIYGYKKWPCEWYFTGRYIPTHRIMNLLSRLRCESLLDVGGAEGYKSNMARQLFGMRVETSDLSSEACKRAEEIYGLKATPVDIHELPFADGQFDVVTCSETLEHVTDPAKATEEILRVAKKALIITVPVEDPDHLEENYSKNSHVHAFDVDSFDYLKERGYTVRSEKYLSKRVLYLGMLLENNVRLEYSRERRFPKFVYTIYNRVLPRLGGSRGARVMSWLVASDRLACRTTKDYAGVLCLILKDPSCYGRPRRHVSAARVMKFTVPHHRLRA